MERKLSAKQWNKYQLISTQKMQDNDHVKLDCILFVLDAVMKWIKQGASAQYFDILNPNKNLF